MLTFRNVTEVETEIVSYKIAVGIGLSTELFQNTLYDQGFSTQAVT